MSAFDALYREFAAPALVEHLGIEDEADYVTLVRANGTSLGTFAAIVDPEEAVEQQGPEKIIVRQIRRFRFAWQDGLPFWSAAPETGGTIVYGDVNYHIDAVETLTQSFATVRAVRRPIVEQARPGYRRQ